jgi:hypothetical protein
MKHKKILWIMLILITACSSARINAGTLHTYYTKIESGQAFERYSRTGPYADIVAELENGRFVFWRGSSYLPYWQTSQGKWFVDELFERKGDGPAERPDKVNTYSRIIIAECTPDRAVICWRYLPQFSGKNPHEEVDATKFVEEYFDIRSNGTVMRTVKQGTERIDAWLDPQNKTVQTFKLAVEGIIDKRLTPSASLSALAPVAGSPVKEGFVAEPVRYWTFNEGQGNVTSEGVTGQTSNIAGHKSLWKVGVSGTALQFDGYSSEVSLPSAQAPKITNALTLEGWVAIGAYPWNWTPIVQQCEDVPVKSRASRRRNNQEASQEEKGYFLGISGLGQIGLKLCVGDRWEELVSDRILERHRWYHVAGTYDGSSGRMRLYIDGKPIIDKALSPASIGVSQKNIRIGRGKPMRPIRPVRANTFVDTYAFDGLIDEVRIYDKALTDSQVRQSSYRFRPIRRVVTQPDMEARILPTGERRGRFGAYYCNLRFYETWDNLWRFGPYPDVVVEFDQSPCQFVFWRGTCYIPMMVNERGHWYSNEFNETWGRSGGQGCQEPMSDKESYTNHARIIENTPARVVIQWRYPLVDVHHVIANYDDDTGWGDWADWYYTIYPDGVAAKKMHLWTNGPRNHEWQEGMAILGPDQHPEQILETEPALILAGMDGSVSQYNWTTGPPRGVNYKNKTIHIVNYQADYDPFTIADFRGGNVYSGEVTDYAVFPSWNHWPVAQMPSDGRYAAYPDRTAHSSLTHIYWPTFKEASSDRPFYQKIMLEGMSNQPIGDIVKLARSWLQAPAIEEVTGATDAVYDPSQRAYVMTADGPEIAFELAASAQSPLVNPAIVIKHWKEKRDARVQVNGRMVPSGPNLRQGITYDTDGQPQRIIWLNLEEEKPIKLSIQ